MSEMKDQYKNKLLTTEPKTTDSSYYNDLRKESYRTMLNSEIQANIAKQQALKYTQNAMASQGLGTQGISESSRVGIGNAYQNAMSEATNQYRQSLLNIDEKERAENLANFEKNATNMAEFLGGTIATDENGKTTNVDLEKYKQILSNYGVTFDQEGNADFSNSKLSESDRGYYQQHYIDTLKAYNDLQSGESKSEQFAYTGDNYSTDFTKGYATNNNFKVTMGNKTYEMEIGNQPQGYAGVGATNEYLKNTYANKKVGEVWAYDNPNAGIGKGYISFMTKDKDSNIRMVEAVGKNKTPKNAEIFANLLEKLGYKVEFKNAKNIIINGSSYTFDQRADGSCGFIKIE